MRIRLKIILATLIGTLSLGLVVIAALPFMVDVNDFKAEIEQTIAENTGRKLIITGEVDLSVFPWLGINIGHMTLSNPESFHSETFAEIAKGQIKVKLWPLLSKQIQISNIVLKGVNVNLAKNAQGLSNWDDLLTLMKNSPKEKSPLKLLEIAPVSIQDGQISWQNLQKKQHIDIQNLQLSTEKLTFNRPFALDLAFIAQDMQNHITETVDFSGHLTLTEALNNFELSKIKLKTETESQEIPTGKLLLSTSGEVKFDLTHKNLKLTPLHIKIGEMSVSASSLISWQQQPFKIKGFLHIDNFDAAEFMQKQLQIKLPPMIDEKALTWMTADFHLDADETHARLENLELQLDETTLKGVAQIRNFAKPEIAFKLSLDKVNFDRYLPPPVSDRSIQNQNVFLTETPSKPAIQLPVEALKKLDLNGQLRIEELKIKNLTMQGLRFILNAKNGILQSQQSVDRLYQGSHQSKMILNVNGKQPLLTLNGQLNHVQIEPFLTAWQGHSRFAGLMNLDAKLESSGNSDIALQSSLNGRIQFSADDMVIRGFNLQKMIDNGKILLGETELNRERERERTFFSSVNATAIVSHGFLINNDLLAISSKAKVTGMGAMHLNSQLLDYKLMAVSLKEKELSLTPAHLPVFINIGGHFNAPAYQVDLAAMGVGL